MINSNRSMTKPPVRETRCSRCSRVLTDPVFITKGIGKTCIEKEKVDSVTLTQKNERRKRATRATTPKPQKHVYDPRQLRLFTCEECGDQDRGDH